MSDWRSLAAEPVERLGDGMLGAGLGDGTLRPGLGGGMLGPGRGDGMSLPATGGASPLSNLRLGNKRVTFAHSFSPSYKVVHERRAAAYDR